MFNIFKRSKVEDWEIRLLLNVIGSLPINTDKLKAQVNDGLFRGVLTNASDIEGYTAFKFNSGIFKKHEDVQARSYVLQGITVYDTRSNVFLPYTIYVSSGVINGYSIQGASKFKIDPDRFDVTRFRQVFDKNPDWQEVENLLNDEERQLVNPSHVYAVELDGKRYYRLLDLEDGDFIGLDQNGMAYEIRHDPFEIIEIRNKSLIEIIKTYKD